jgi:hypothetical protein
MPEVVIEGDSTAQSPQAVIYNRGGKHRIKAFRPVEIIAPRARYLGAGKKDRLYDQDVVRIGQIVFTFTNPGDKRRP